MDYGVVGSRSNGGIFAVAGAAHSLSSSRHKLATSVFDTVNTTGVLGALWELDTFRVHAGEVRFVHTSG